MSEFFVGQKVVFIGDSEPPAPSLRHELTPPLVERAVYVVREKCEADFYNAAGYMGRLPGLRLVGIYRSYEEGHGYSDTKDFPYAAYAFRPLESKSIALFRKIAQGVTDGKPIVPDDYRIPVPAIDIRITEKIVRDLMDRWGGA